MERLLLSMNLILGYAKVAMLEVFNINGRLQLTNHAIVILYPHSRAHITATYIVGILLHLPIQHRGIEGASGISHLN